MAANYYIKIITQSDTSVVGLQKHLIKSRISRAVFGQRNDRCNVNYISGNADQKAPFCLLKQHSEP